MPDLSFQVERAHAIPYATAPLLGFEIRVTNATPEPIHTVALRCQIQIEPTRRRYTPGEQEKLHDLFGEPHRWGQTVRNMLWTHSSVIVPAFTGDTLVDLPAPCTFDFNVAVVKYFHGLDDGEIPLCLQFSGSVFHQGGSGELQVAPISWDKEAKFRLPVRVWKEMMDLYYPNSAWLCVPRDVLDRLQRLKTRLGVTTIEQMLERLVEDVEAMEEARQ